MHRNFAVLLWQTDHTGSRVVNRDHRKFFGITSGALAGTGGDRAFEVRRDRSKERAISRLRRLRRALPPGFTFSREEANER